MLYMYIYIVLTWWGDRCACLFSTFNTLKLRKRITCYLELGKKIP